MPKKLNFLQLVVKGDKDKAEAWIKKGLSAKELERTDVGGYSAMTQAALLGHHQILRHLRLAGVDVDKKDGCGRTPLYVASLIGRVNVVKVLLDGEVDISMRCTDQCQNAVEAAIEYRHPEVVALLGAAAGRLLLEDLRKGNLERAQEWLIWPGLDTNVQSFQGSTPLHLAMQFGNAAIVQGLAKLGADPTAKNRAGVTPFDVARGHKNDHLLLAFEAAQDELAEIPVARVELPTEDKERRPLVSGSGITQADLVKQQRRRSMAPSAMNSTKSKKKTVVPGQGVSGGPGVSGGSGGSGLKIGLPEVASGGWKHKKADELGLTIDAILMTKDDNSVTRDRLLVDLSRKKDPPARPAPAVAPVAAASSSPPKAPAPVPLGAIRAAAQKAARAQEDEEDEALNSLLGFGSTPSLPPVPRKSAAAPTEPPPRPMQLGASGHSRSKSTGAVARSLVSPRDESPGIMGPKSTTSSPRESTPYPGAVSPTQGSIAEMAARLRKTPIARADPPAPAADPPAPRRDPPAPGGDPPAPRRDPPAPGFDPPAPGFDPPAPRGLPTAPPRGGGRGRGRGGGGGRGVPARGASTGALGRKAVSPRGRPAQDSSLETPTSSRERAFTPHQLPLPAVPPVAPVITSPEARASPKPVQEVVNKPPVPAKPPIPAKPASMTVSPRRSAPTRQQSTPAVSRAGDTGKPKMVLVPRRLAATTDMSKTGSRRLAPTPGSGHTRSKSAGGAQMKAAIMQSGPHEAPAKPYKMPPKPSRPPPVPM